MMLDTDEKLTIVHFNRRSNGGNLVLEDFSSKLALQIGYGTEEIFLSEGFLNILTAIFSKKIIIFSNPILLIFFCLKKNSIYFMQSIEEKLFSKYDFNALLVFCYQISIKVLLRISKNIKIFNSEYTQHYYKGLKRCVGCYCVVDNLYYKESVENKKNSITKNEKQCIWIGTKHKRKGFSDLIKIARDNPKYKFISVFSGEYPEVLDLPENIDLRKNISHTEVKNLVSSSRYSIITSTFESLCLPIYEGLLFGNIILATPADFIKKNGLLNHITVLDSKSNVDLSLVLPNTEYEFKNPEFLNEALIRKILYEI